MQVWLLNGLKLNKQKGYKWLKISEITNKRNKVERTTHTRAHKYG